MSVRRWRPPAAVGALIAFVLTVAACSGSTQAAGPDAAPLGTTSPAATAPSAPPSGNAPITAIAPPTAVPASTDPSATALPPGTASGGSGIPGPGTSHTGTAAPSTSAAPVTPDPPPPPAASVTGTPALGSTAVAPIEPITIGAQGGRISWLTFTGPDGKKVDGTLAEGGATWTLDEPLGFGRTYTVAGVAVNPAGIQTRFEGTYVTATTIEPVTTTISPGDGAVVGVAAPVIVKFGLNPQDKALVERHMKIVTTPAVDGSWAWIRHDGDKYPSLDWRPKDYWPAGTKVHVESNIYGVKFADGWYGGDDVSVDFTIGRNQVVVADAKTHRMTVKRDGKVVATYNGSFGRGDVVGDPNLVTRSGIHVVMDKHPVYKMSNPRYGYTNVTEYWAVRISNNGEFIHNNPGTSPWQLANANITHGCVNLSWDNAKAYYNSAIYGDPVEIVGTSIKLGPSDGDIYDWAIPWSTWLTRSALAKNTIWK